MVKYSEV